MKFNKKNKKGFTIVELVIVLAVIGILTAILVPTFVNLVNNAQRAENQTFVKNLNTQMAVLENDPTYKIKDEETGEDIIIGGENHTMYDAIIDAKEIGHDVEKLTPVNNNEIIWDSVANRFAIVTSAFDPANPTDKSTVVYSDGGIKGKNHELWKIYTAETMPATQTFSIYAKKDAWNVANAASGVSIGEGEEAKVSITGLKVGFDVGFNKNFASISYARAASDPTQTVSIRGAYGTEISVDAPNDVVYQYGKINYGDVTHIKGSSLHVCGEVGFIKLASGRVIADGGIIHSILLTEKPASGDAPAVIQEENGGSIVRKLAVSAAVATANNENQGLNLSTAFESQKGNVLDEGFVLANVVEEMKEQGTKDITPKPAGIEINETNYLSVFSENPTETNFYLSESFSISSQWNIPADREKITIDLNQKTISSGETDTHQSLIDISHGHVLIKNGSLINNNTGESIYTVVGGNCVFEAENVIFGGSVVLKIGIFNGDIVLRLRTVDMQNGYISAASFSSAKQVTFECEGEFKVSFIDFPDLYPTIVAGDGFKDVSDPNQAATPTPGVVMESYKTFVFKKL